MTDAVAMSDEDLIYDCCDILGVDEDATLEEIRAAFRHKAKLLHPDRNRSASATEDFIRLGEAYRVLRAAAPRRALDHHPAETAAPVVVRPPPKWHAAAAVFAALIIAIGTASTFAYLGLRGGPGSVAVPRVAEMSAAPAARRGTALHQDAHVLMAAAATAVSPKPPISMPRPSGAPISGGVADQVSDGQISKAHDTDVAEADAVEAVVAAPVDVARATSTSTEPGPESDEALVASLADSMEAPFARSPMPTQMRAKPPAAMVVAPHVHRMVLAPKLAAVPLTKPVVLRQRAATPHVVRFYPWRPFPPRAAIYAHYYRVPVRHAPVKRYQAQTWRAGPADWQF